MGTWKLDFDPGAPVGRVNDGSVGGAYYLPNCAVCLSSGCLFTDCPPLGYRYGAELYCLSRQPFMDGRILV